MTNRRSKVRPLVRLARFLWLVGLLGLAACGGAATTPPPNGVSQAQAVEIATQAVQPKGPIRVVSADAGQFSRFSGGVALTTAAGDPWVWSIVLSGLFKKGCPSAAPSGVPATGASPSTSPCAEVVVPREHVLVDAASGQVLLTVGGN
jgi:hypothetical protein